MQRQSLVAYAKPLETTEVPTPVPQGSEVLLRVSHCGVCHSDIHLQDGYFDLGGGNKLDVQAAASCRSRWVTRLRALSKRSGRTPRALRSASVTQHILGSAVESAGFALAVMSICATRRARSASRSMVATPPIAWCRIQVLPRRHRHRSGDRGALMCSGLTGYSAIKKAVAFQKAGPILIVGLGGVGMMGLQFAKAMSGGAPVFAADIDASKRDAAVKLGAAEAFDPADPASRKAIAKATGGGVGASVDFAGSDKSLAFAQGVVAKGGAAIVVGLIGGSFQLPVPMFPLRALTIMGSYVGSPSEAQEMLALVKAGKVAPIPVETRPLSDEPFARRSARRPCRWPRRHHPIRTSTS